MSFSKGQLVTHPVFGLGKVVGVAPSSLTVFFKDKDRNPRKLSATQSQLTIAESQQDPWLDMLDVPFAGSGKLGIVLTHEQMVTKFLEYFPEGFSDPKYLEFERSEKWAAHELWNETLGEKEFRRLLKENAYAEIAKRLAAVETKINQIFKTDKSAMREAIEEEKDAQDFAVALYDYVYGAEEIEERFNAFCKVLENLPQGPASTKWPLQTMFLFLAHPSEFLFLKPTAAQEAAKRRVYALNYDAQPKWWTYHCWLHLGRLLFTELKPLNPKDMIDVQAFLHITADDKYKVGKNSPKAKAAKKKPAKVLAEEA